MLPVFLKSTAKKWPGSSVDWSCDVFTLTQYLTNEMAIMHLWPDLYFQIDNAVFDFGAYHVMELSWQLLLVCSHYQLTLLLPILLGYHSFSKKAFSEKLTFHTPWYTHMYTHMSAYRSKRDTHMCAYRSNHDTHLYVRIGVTVVLICLCVSEELIDTYLRVSE